MDAALELLLGQLGEPPLDQVQPGRTGHLILDNYATHKTSDIKRWLLAHPRFRLRFTPKPDSLFADRGYDHDIYRDQVRARGIVPAIARRGTLNGTGLGTYRWVVERSFAWLHGFRRLRIRWERRADIHEALLRLACCLITDRQLRALR
ncbi:transposase [Streptomyces sp. SAI-163]